MKSLDNFIKFDEMHRDTNKRTGRAQYQLEGNQEILIDEENLKQSLLPVSIQFKDLVISKINGSANQLKGWIGKSIALLFSEEPINTGQSFSQFKKEISLLQNNESRIIEVQLSKDFGYFFENEIQVTCLEKGHFDMLIFQKRQTKGKGIDIGNQASPLFKDILDLSLVLFRMSNERNICYYFNHQWLQFTGKQLKSELTEDWHSFVVKEDRNEVNTTLALAHKKRTKYELTFRMERFDGNIRWLHESGIPLFDNDGNYMGYLSVTVDISGLKEFEEQYRDANEKLKAFAEKAPVMFKMADEHNTFYYFSKQWLKFTGHSIKDEIGPGWKNGIHNEDYKMVDRTLSRALKDRKKYELSYRLRDSQGIYKWVIDTGIPIHSHLGEFSGFISATVDIHDRKELENLHSRQEVMRESEKKLQYSLDHSRFIALSIDEKYRITYCNPYFLEISGFDAKEVLHKPVKTLLEFPDSKRDIHSILDSLFAQTNYAETFEARIKSKFREKSVIRFSSLVLFSESETFPSVMLIGENVTERRKVQSALQKSNEQLKDLFDNANDLIMIFDHAGKFLFVNGLTKSRLGYSDDDIPNLTVDDILDPRVLDDTHAQFHRVSSGEKIPEVDTIFLTKSGKKVFVRGNVNCSFQHGKLKEFRCIFYDVTERIKADKAQSLYYSISNLAINSADLDSLFKNIHQELKNIIPAENFYIVTYDSANEMLHFPYLIDSYFKPNKKHYIRKFKSGLTEYVIKTKKPYLLTSSQLKKMVQKKTIELHGRMPEIWLGVPLILQGNIAGVIALQDYEDSEAYTLKDLDLLVFISGQMANAIDRKQKEEKISEQTARIQSIFESGNHMIWSVDRQMNFSSINQNMKDFLNENFQTGSRRRSVITDVGKFNKSIFWRQKYKQAFSGSPVQFECSFTNLKTRGISWKNIVLNPILLKSGQIDEVSGIAYDITENKNAEFALAKSEEKFRDIFESFQDIYFRCDFKGNIIMLSPSVKDLLGYDPVHLLGRDITNYYLYSKKSNYLLRDIVTKKTIRNFEASLIDKNGKILQCICNIRLVYDNSIKSMALEGVARDISKLKEANLELKQAKEVAEKSLKVKELFLANMSHEIRTPMNGIIGMIDLLHGTSITDEQKHYINTIKRSSETLLNILNDILDLSKIEAGKMQLKKEPVKLKNVLEKIYALFSQQALTKNINLYYHLSDSLPEYAMIDETRLLQILSNLISNAIKFTEGGGSIDIDLKRAKIPGKKHMIRCVVSDSGIGISHDNQNQLFGIFSQIDNTSTKSYSGTGLGLAISKELCRLMGGKIGVYSTLGLGSSFWFTFEAEPTKKQIIVENSIIEPDIKIENFFKDENPVILLVDDNGVNRQVASEILRKSGCQVDNAEDGRQAIEAVQQKQYDLVFMDIQMPEMDGVTATKHIKELNLKNLPPIIAMTAYSMKEDKERFLQQGLDDYIAKPIRANDLLNKVRRYVKDEGLFVEGSTPKNELSGEIINMEVVNQLISLGGEEMVQEVFKDFIKETTEQIESAFSATSTGDHSELQTALHTLKGNAGTLGVEKLSKQAEFIEKNIKSGNFDSLEQDLSFLRLMFEEFEGKYDQLIQKT